MAGPNTPSSGISGRSPFQFGDGGAFLGNFVENAAIPTFLLDRDGRLVYANRAFLGLTGYAPDECVGEPFDMMVYPDNSDMVNEQFRQLVEHGGDGYRAERRYRRKNGEAVWVLASVSIVPPEDGHSIYLSVQAIDIDAQKRAEAALAASERRWNFALESARQGVWETDLVTGANYFSPMLRLIRGYDPDEPFVEAEEEWLQRVHPDDRDRVKAIVHRQNSGELSESSFEYRELHKDGHYIWIASRGAADAWTADGKPSRLIGTDTDITQRKRAEQETRELSRRLKLALEVSELGVFEGDLATGELFWDERVREIYGVPPALTSLNAGTWEKALHPDDAQRVLSALARAVVSKETFSERFRIIRMDGGIRTLLSRATFYEDGNGAPKFIGVNWDITEDVALAEGFKAAKELAEARNAELEQTKARIEAQSLHDALTGLPNRRYLDQMLNRNDSGAGLALLHIDLDRFKHINDTLGHAAGDVMLKHVASLLASIAGSGRFVARVGGDEFIVVCVNETDTSPLAALAEQIIKSIRQPVPYEGHFCRFGASIGIAIEAGGAVDARRVLINGDIALYRAKGRGGNRYEFFSKALQDEIESTKRIADDILRGIEQHEFLPYYQPLFDARTFDIAGVEALVRWQHPTEGILAPVRFLKIAEDLNVLSALDRDILEHTIVDLEHWKRLGLPICSASVNVSFRRLHDDQLIPSLRKLNIRPGTISFEFLESIFLDEFDPAIAWNIDAIKDMGIGIDVDDFGTGHTSFISLLKLSPRRFKIDRQLIAPIVHIPEQRRLVASIIEIGKTLGIKVVAEGVETMEQAYILREMGCDILQGYAFARPMPAEQLIEWVRAESWRLEPRPVRQIA